MIMNSRELGAEFGMRLTITAAGAGMDKPGLWLKHLRSRAGQAAAEPLDSASMSRRMSFFETWPDQGLVYVYWDLKNTIN
jgi:hypothetical protein